MWDALVDAGVPGICRDTIRRLYEDQIGVVVGDKVSTIFHIDRGTKQGDPIRPPLCNCVLEGIFRKLKTSWKSKLLGIKIGDGDSLQNLRFADDVLIIDKFLSEVEDMLHGLSVLDNESVKPAFDP